MNMTATAEYLGVTQRTVKNMVLDGRLQAYELGPKIIRFRRSEVDAALTPVKPAPVAVDTRSRRPSSRREDDLPERPQAEPFPPTPNRKARRRPRRRRYPDPDALKDLATR
jgi:excisionase family DNA binding protein